MPWGVTCPAVPHCAGHAPPSYCGALASLPCEAGGVPWRTGPVCPVQGRPSRIQPALDTASSLARLETKDELGTLLLEAIWVRTCTLSFSLGGMVCGWALGCETCPPFSG